MEKDVLVARAAALGELHRRHRPLVLPTVWDAWSARTAVAAGFEALTIGSHPLAGSRGAADHEGQTFEEVVAAVRRITAAVDVPVSVDLEAGYGQSPADLVAGLLDAGGVPVWVNGRTDLFLHAEDAAAVADEAITRLRALVAAGADSVYPVRIQDDDALVTAVVGAVPVPVNCTAHPVRHDLARFAALGVGRVTYGPTLQYALTDAMREMIAPWRG
jgi:2-methylisocitrate lyase-like PEP mutase family enzyme